MAGQSAKPRSESFEEKDGCRGRIKKASSSRRRLRAWRRRSIPPPVGFCSSRSGRQISRGGTGSGGFSRGGGGRNRGRWRSRGCGGSLSSSATLLRRSSDARPAVGPPLASPSPPRDVRWRADQVHHSLCSSPSPWVRQVSYLLVYVITLPPYTVHLILYGCQRPAAEASMSHVCAPPAPADWRPR